MLLPRLPLFLRRSLLLPPGAGRRNRSPKASTTADRREAAAPLERVLGAAPLEFRSLEPAPRGASASWATGRRGYLFPRPFSAAAPSRHSVTRTLALAPGGAARLQQTRSCRRAHGPRLPVPASEVRAAAAERAERDSETQGSQQWTALSPVPSSAPAPLGEETPGWYGKMDASCGQAQPRPARSAERPWATPLGSPSAPRGRGSQPQQRETPSRPQGLSLAEGGSPGWTLFTLHWRNPELDVSITERDVTPRC